MAFRKDQLEQIRDYALEMSFKFKNKRTSAIVQDLSGIVDFTKSANYFADLAEETENQIEAMENYLLKGRNHKQSKGDE